MKTIALEVRFRVPSGSSIALENLGVSMIRQAGPDVRFVTVRYRDQPLPPELDELEAVVVPKMPAPLELIWNEIRLPGLLARRGVDLFHGMKQCAPFRLRCSCVHTVDAVKRGSSEVLPLPLGPKLYFGWFVCNRFKRSDHLLPVSQHVSDFLEKDLRVDPACITIVHNGLHEIFLDSDRDTAGAAENPLGIDAPMIVCVGSVIPLKNQLAVVKAMARIADHVPHHIALLGREDAGYAQEIKEAAKAGGIADRLHRVGFVDAQDLLRYLLAAEAMIHVPRTEGFGLAPGEGMACGVPLVVTDRGALREVCGDAALYIDDPDDHAALAEHMLSLLTDAGLRETLRQRGLKRAANLSWPEAARKTLNVYRQLLDCG